MEGDGGEDGGEGWRGMEGRDGGGGVVLGLVVVRRRVVVLFRRVILAVSSLRVPVDVSLLSRCFCVGRTLLCGKRLQVVVVVFVRGGGRFCMGVRSRYFGVLLIIWAVVLVCGRSLRCMGGRGS